MNPKIEIIINHPHVKGMANVLTLIDMILFIITFGGGVISLWPTFLAIAVVVITLWILIIVSKIGIEKDIDLIKFKAGSVRYHNSFSPSKLGLYIEIDNKALKVITPVYVNLKVYLDYVDITTFEWWNNKDNNITESDKTDIKVRGMEGFQKNGKILLQFTPPKDMVNTMEECRLEGVIIFSDGRKDLPPKVIYPNLLKFNVNKEKPHVKFNQ